LGPVLFDCSGGLEVLDGGPDEEAELAAVEWGEGDGRWDVGAEMAEPEANGGRVLLELDVAPGPAVEETGEKIADGGSVEDDEEGPELGGVLPMLEGVEVALGGASAGLPAAPSTALRAGSFAVGVRHWEPPLCLSVNGLGTDYRVGGGGGGGAPPQIVPLKPCI
jgi:hypothetical protein